MWDNDDVYRYLGQDMLGEINIENLKKRPRRELRRVLDIGMSRHRDHEANRWLMFPKYRAAKLAILLMPKRYINWLVDLICRLDMSKMILDEDDLARAQFKLYNFRGRPYRNLVRDGQGFIVDMKGTGQYVPKENEIIFSYTALKPLND